MSRKLTTQEKKVKGTYNVTRDADRDFSIKEGLLKMNPPHPEGYTPEMIELWNRLWRHLVKHEYGKESDYELVNVMVYEWFQYLKYRPFDHTAKLAKDALNNYLAASNALCINPNALGRAASLQKKDKPATLTDMLKKKQA